MELRPGDKFGPYELVSQIGEGGMGEVWKARDTRLDRTVALKVSRAEFTARFEREAFAIAAFNHANICALYDVGPNYLVMELIDGVPLQGPLPVERAVAYAGQILDALDAAHRKGFTHRDLKPANILVTKQGIKLLDFGLAKQSAADIGPDDETQAAITKYGQITGTLQYMSPEQLQGKEADGRSDIFSFGCVLYEMLSGTRAFTGSTGASVIAAILEREPEPLKTTPPLDRVVRKCLAKDPDERFQNARDLKYNLGLAMEGERSGAAPSQSRFGKGGWIAAGVFAVIAAGALAALVFLRPKPVEPYRLALNPPPGSQFEFAGNRGGSAISPDGRKVAFVAGNALWVRPLDSDTAARLAGTEGAYDPFWSPDQRSIGFFAETKLMRVDFPAGPVIKLAALETVGRNGSWNADGTILFSENNRPLFRIQGSGGKPETLTRLNESMQESAHYHPSFFPDGDHFLYMIRSLVETDAGIYVGSLKDPALRRRVATALSNAVYVPAAGGYPGYLVFNRQGVLVAQPFDAKALRTTGEPEVVASSVGVLLNNQFANFSASRTGTILFGTAGTAKNRLAWLDRNGKVTPVSTPPDYFNELLLSPDGSRVLLVKRTASGASIWTFDFRRGALSLAVERGIYADWSGDGRSIIYDAGRALWRKNLDSAGQGEVAATLDEGLGAPVEWSPDERFVVVPEPRGLTVISLADGKSNWLKRTTNARSPRFSPDGKWLAYASPEEEGSEVVVQDFPAGRTRMQVSTRGGTFPAWRHDGKELFYLTMDGHLMAVDVRSGAAGLEFGVPHALFSVNNLAVDGVLPLDAAPDGQRFLCLLTVESDPRDNQLTVLLNWRAALRK